MAEIGKDIKKAKLLLEQGELVAIPTETVYGLAGNALDVAAVASIFRVKKRPQFDPLIVHVPDIGHAELYAQAIPPKAAALAEKFWPGPLTLILEKKNIIPYLVTSGMNTVGLRCPNHALTSSLLKTLHFPLAAPSANPFGYVSPTRAEHVDEQLGQEIAYILDGGKCVVGIESTIIGFEDKMPVIYRMGGLSQEDIEAVIGSVHLQTYSTSNPKSPGQLKSHYAPRVKIIVGDLRKLVQQYPSNTAGILSFNKDFHAPFQYILSTTGSMEEAARNFFTALREFDKMPIKIILAEQVPDIGLGKAINDRLRRAAAG